VSDVAYALPPAEVLRSIDASRDTLGKHRMKLIDVVLHVKKLTNGAPYAVVGGLAQILWARKTHTDDLDLALATNDLQKAYRRVEADAARWAERLGKKGAFERALARAADLAGEGLV
jgi:hypothetical protein